MKFDDIKSPIAMGLHDANGICIKIESKDQFDVLMERLKAHGWSWLGDWAKFHSEIKFIYLADYITWDNVFESHGIYTLVTMDWGEQPSVALAVAPRNNDGRGTCHWCGAPCKKVQGIVNTYTVCTKCGK